MKITKFILLLLTFSAVIIYSCTTTKPPFNTWNEKDVMPIGKLTSDAVYSAFLKNFKTDVESHNWNKVMVYFDSENFKSQQRLGIDTSQYIQEGLGLNFVNNIIKKKIKDKSVYSRINNIKDITFDSYRNSTGDLIEIFGNVSTYDNEELYIRIDCKKNDKQIVIIPPIG
jgi:hypothetical protein